MRLAIIAMLIAGCGVEPWPRMSTITTYANGDPQTEQDWRDAVWQATNTWAAALGPDCPFPFEFGPDGCPVRLIPTDRWLWGESRGIEGDCFIEIRGTDPWGHRRILEHEFGHAIGIGHSNDHASVMRATISNADATITPDDARRARAELGCDG